MTILGCFGVFFLHKTICCVYSLEAHLQGAFNENPQHKFLWKMKIEICCNVFQRILLQWTSREVNVYMPHHQMGPFKYRIYHKYWNTLPPYHTCSKI